ncbi:unnamed protein product [marine sediment metagenome]|uniref:DUF1097 domain-containing protein n=1 Tax=marine sediment metagenome TaxID=412755 RepID=X1CNS4_9ZZZZ
MNKRKIIVGILFGLVAGIIDVIPMIIMGLTLDACLSAFFMWIISGFLISTSDLEFYPILKGIVISALLFVPVGIMIAFAEPLFLIQIIITLVILGSFLGFCIERYGSQKE